MDSEISRVFNVDSQFVDKHNQKVARLIDQQSLFATIARRLNGENYFSIKAAFKIPRIFILIIFVFQELLRLNYDKTRLRLNFDETRKYNFSIIETHY